MRAGGKIGIVSAVAAAVVPLAWTATAAASPPPRGETALGGALQVYKTDLPPLATIGGVKITGGGYCFSFTPAPHGNGLFYGITDRGPNVDGPNGTKVEPLPSFQPAIAEFRLVDGRAQLLRTIPMRAADGSPYSGRVNCQANTGETITDPTAAPAPTGGGRGATRITAGAGSAAPPRCYVASRNQMVISRCCATGRLFATWLKRRAAPTTSGSHCPTPPSAS